jgi:phosphate transport system substrate-binding protein
VKTKSEARLAPVSGSSTGRLLLAKLLVFSFLCTVVVGCGDREQGEPASLPTRGDLVIGVDESLRPFAEAEIEMFSVYYPDARLTPEYLPEKQVIEKLLANEIQTAILCRNLYPDESDYIAGAHGHSARAFKLADDAIVAVVNKENPVNAISMEDMKGVLSGTISDWGQLTATVDDQTPILVIFTRSSSIDRYFTSDGSLFSPASIYALDTTTEVVDYVRKNASAVGILGGSWFYQKGSTNTDMKILSLSAVATENGTGEKRPSREVYAVTHEPNTGLGSGFISFMAGQKGQLILSKAGMTPYKPIERQIKVADSF